MGTNFYLRTKPSESCPTCGHTEKPSHELHIGKSSAGWNFGLRIYPPIDGRPDSVLEPFGVSQILELDMWTEPFARHEIYDDCGERVSAADMIGYITKRSHPRGLTSMCVDGPGWDGAFRRSAYVDVRPGLGTYDLCNFSFS
jgi:hypothetical protein